MWTRPHAHRRTWLCIVFKRVYPFITHLIVNWRNNASISIKITCPQCRSTNFKCQQLFLDFFFRLCIAEPTTDNKVRSLFSNILCYFCKNTFSVCSVFCSTKWRRIKSTKFLGSAKGHLISKCLFGVFKYFQKMNENKSTWGIISSYVEFFVRFLRIPKSSFEIIWPLAPHCMFLQIPNSKSLTMNFSCQCFDEKPAPNKQKRLVLIGWKLWNLIISN